MDSGLGKDKDNLLQLLEQTMAATAEVISDVKMRAMRSVHGKTCAVGISNMKH